MILDNQLMFTGTSNGATAGITSGLYTDAPTTGTQNSSNIIDLHIAAASLWAPILANLQGARDLGIGDDPALKMLIQVTTAFAGGTSLQVGLQGAPDNGSAAPGTFVTWWLSPAVALASLTAGARLYDMDMPRPPAGVGVPRFLRLTYVSAGTFSGGGSIEGTIVLDRHDQMYNATNNAILGGYPPGIVINN
jgi:hypothetical protein